MKENLKIKIPFWYKPLIKFMPSFWSEMPIFENGKWKAECGLYDFNFSYVRWESSRFYKSNQKAYLKARFKALMLDRFDKSNRGVYWTIKSIK